MQPTPCINPEYLTECVCFIVILIERNYITSSWNFFLKPLVWNANCHKFETNCIFLYYFVIKFIFSYASVCFCGKTHSTELPGLQTVPAGWCFHLDSVKFLFMLLKKRTELLSGTMDHRPWCADKRVRSALLHRSDSLSSCRSGLCSVAFGTPHKHESRCRAVPLSQCDNGKVQISPVWSRSSSRTGLLFSVTAKQVLVSTGDVWLFHLPYMDVQHAVYWQPLQSSTGRLVMCMGFILCISNMLFYSTCPSIHPCMDTPQCEAV